MIAGLGLKLSAVFRRTAPEPFVLAVLLTILSLALALVFGRFPDHEGAGLGVRATALLDAWRGTSGIWAFLAFGMQMCLILVTGHALASSPPVRRLIEKLASLPRSGPAAAAGVGLVAALAGLVNWGLGLIVGALLAREVARAMTARGLRVHYPLLVAAGYMGLLVWHGGLSGTAPLKSTTIEELATVFPARTVESIGDRVVTPLDETLFSGLNLVVSGGLLLLIPTLLWMLWPRSASDCVAPPPRVIEAEAAAAPADAPSTIPEHLERSRVLAWILAGLMLAGMVRFAQTSGLTRLGPNEVNLAMLALGLVATGSLRAYADAIEDAARGCAGILIQFPLYAGIMGVLTVSGLIDQTARLMTELAGPTTLPVFTMLSAAAVNFFVPSGGGQWGVQGPIAMQAAVDAGVRPGTMVMAVAYGDQLTNMLQPFWALPLLALTGVKARDIVGYTAIVMLGAIIWISLCLLVFSGVAG